MRRGERAITLLVVAIGFSAMVVQLLTIREFLAQFHGNEYLIALILFAWLGLGGLGSLLARLANGCLPARLEFLLGLGLLLAFLPPLQFLAIRWLRDLIFLPGTSVGFYPTLAFILATLAPYGLLLGFTLLYALFVVRQAQPDFAGAWLYMADNLGNVAGGCLFSFFLVHLLTPMPAIAVAELPLLAAIFGLTGRLRAGGAIRVGLGGTAAFLLLGVGVESYSLTPATGELVEYRESRYGRIAVQGDGGQYTLFVDGAPLFSERNESAAEEAVHFPLAQVENPRRVLLISARSGMMAELAKYGLERIDYVELDPLLAEVQFRYGLLQRIKGLRVIHEDGRAFLRHSRERYDAILVNLSEPETYQANRFFTDRFLQLAADHLAPHGVLSLALAGYDNYLDEAQRRKISSLYNTVGLHFSHCLLLPGQEVRFLCARQPLSRDIPALLAAKGIATAYLSRYFAGDLTGERIDGLHALLVPKVPGNFDTSPYLMRMIFEQWFAQYATSPFWFVGGVGVLLSIYLLRIKSEEFVLFTTGFLAMGAEILVLFAFQIFQGYLYFQVGIIVTAFLAGLMPGAWLGARCRSRGRSWLALLDLLLLGLLALFLWVVVAFGDRTPAPIFLLLAFLFSLLCGGQFSLVLALRGGDNVAASGCFAADLLGAAAGTLLTSVVLIPYGGLVGATAGLMGLKLAGLAVLGVGGDGKN